MSRVIPWLLQSGLIFRKNYYRRTPNLPHQRTEKSLSMRMLFKHCLHAYQNPFLTLITMRKLSFENVQKRGKSHRYNNTSCKEPTLVMPTTPTFSAWVVMPTPGPIRPEMKHPRPTNISEIFFPIKVHRERTFGKHGSVDGMRRRRSLLGHPCHGMVVTDGLEQCGLCGDQIAHE